MLTKTDMTQLRKLSARVQAGPAMTDQEIKTTQRLVSQGLARDLSSFRGTRQRVYLRIWQITEAGKVVIAQEALGRGGNRQGLLISED